MNRYVALLRGINVGGKNKVSMDLLKAMFEDLSCENVTTYINSGNVIFDVDIADIVEFQNTCKLRIREIFGIDVPVMIIDSKSLLEALEKSPTWWDKGDDSKHNAIFVIPPITAFEVMKIMGDSDLAYEKVGCWGQVIFWSAPIITFGRTKWSKISSKDIYNSLTIRNANTTKKLSEMVKLK